MIDTARLLADLKRLVPVLEDDMRLRFTDEPVLDTAFRERYDKARAGGRTGASYETWREGEITQAAVAWLLACVFVRFLEDNELIAERWIRNARDRYQDLLHKGAHRDDREYLELAFADVAALPGVGGLFDRAHNPLFALAPTGTVARRLLDFFRDTAADGTFHDFADTVESTRFLGDLYQDISESARKRYALLQTPDFVVDFILDRTLEPALKEFGLKDFRLMDPACGSGHFLLAAFDRLFRRWTIEEPGTEVSVLAQRALDSVCGVDLNPFAVAVARFRLLIAAVKACGIERLSEAYNWQFSIVAADSLLFGAKAMLDPAMLASDVEEPEAIRRILQEQRYHTVVGNPPYINVEDPALRLKYRQLYRSCSGKYQISVPFTELFFHLSVSHAYVGMITSNAFMKRSFGKKLVQTCLLKWDVTHVIDTSGVYLPGHGTPTAILLGRNRGPVSDVIRAVRGIRGETGIPVDPSKAVVWSAISRLVDQPGASDRWVSVADAERTGFHHHPWSIGGGGAAELKEILDDAGSPLRSEATTAIHVVTLEDDVILAGDYFRRNSVAPQELVLAVEGAGLREWHSTPGQLGVVPRSMHEAQRLERPLWRWRTGLRKRIWFGKTQENRGLHWCELGFIASVPALKIAYGEVATHNHFVLDCSASIFKQTAPVIKLGANATKPQHVDLLGILNSSCACFWLRQVCFPKGGDHVGGDGARIRKNMWEVYFAFDSTKVGQLPLPAGRPTELATAIQAAADERTTLLPANLIKSGTPTRERLEAARHRAALLLRRMIALQEELDWHVYHLYGLIDESLTLPIDQVPEIELGQRAFEIVMARDPELETAWFDRHGSKPHAQIPAHWPEPYRNLVQRRLDRIAADRDIALIEQPEYKRRWNLPKWDELEQDALRSWLLDRLESETIWSREEPELLSVERLTDRVRQDADFRSVAAIYAGRDDRDLSTLVGELVLDEAVPFLPVLRYADSGLRKREQWERTWDLQRREDKGEAVGDIPVPPKYERKDFVTGPAWRLRGKLDVPKERFILYPGLGRDTDPTPVVAWAGFDHGDQARALAGYYTYMRADQGWERDRLLPVLAGVRELMPWLWQWHADLAPMLDEFLRGELAEWTITEDDLKQWRPSTPKRARASRRRTEATGS
ncbi:MAG: BREX-2 system adenine-specific DNA-methyltransferase PglX [Bryobacteraceae bacterium]|nr:BREX-2 system adenine-specific DNA-methyltransferase PglX [Bryobacteraceae bacterium]